jgi:pimeloyl-ACP methyl ester carboxylesterase
VEKYSVNMVVGHSLGGYIAEIIATTRNLKGMAFCSPGTRGIWSFGGERVEGFHNVNWEHDFLGNLLSYKLTNAQPDIFVWTGSHTTYKHSMGDMAEYFEGMPDVTNENIESKSVWKNAEDLGRIMDSAESDGFYFPKDYKKAGLVVIAW